MLEKSLNFKVQQRGNPGLSKCDISYIDWTVALYGFTMKLAVWLDSCDVVCAQSVFKTLSSSAITRLELGGPSGQPRDRIFVSSGAIVKGYTRRGKQFLDFNTNTTEAIRSLYDNFQLFFYDVC